MVKLKIPQKYKRWFTRRAFVNCLRLSLALIVIAWLFEWAHEVIMTNLPFLEKTLFLLFMWLVITIVIWLLAFISPEFIDTVFQMLGFKGEEKEKEEGNK